MTGEEIRKLVETDGAILKSAVKRTEALKARYLAEHGSLEGIDISLTDEELEAARRLLDNLLSLGCYEEIRAVADLAEKASATNGR